MIKKVEDYEDQSGGVFSGPIKFVNRNRGKVAFAFIIAAFVVAVLSQLVGG